MIPKYNHLIMLGCTGVSHALMASGSHRTTDNDTCHVYGNILPINALITDRYNDQL